jgi:hypothetical protein
MSEFEQAMIEELRAIRLLLERQAAPIVTEQLRQLFTAPAEQRKEHNRGVIERARARKP